jgi:uncharacterized protein (DUF58 family)
MSSRLVFLLIATGAAWILAFNTGRNLAFNLAYLLTGILGLSYFWARTSLRSVNIRRFTRTRRSQVGQFAEERLEVTNNGRWSKLWLEIEDYSNLPWHDVSRVVSNMGRNSSHRWQVKTLCTQRGRFRLGPMALHSGDPLGIFDVIHDIPNTGYIVVYPLTVDLSSFEPSISDLAGGEARHRRTYQVTTNAAGVRDYAPGDSLNRIHWPTTARMSRLMTKEFELDPTADVWLYLDLFQGAETLMPWRPSPPDVGLFALSDRRKNRSQIELPPSTTEYIVTITASLARFFLARNRAVGMSSRGRSREFLQADRGERQLSKMLEGLAVVEAVGNLPFSHLIATDGIRLNRNDTLLAVSADPNPEWAIALQHLQRRGVNSIAIVVDSHSFGHSQQSDALLSELSSAGIPAYRVRREEPIDEALSHTIMSDRVSAR